MPWALVVLCSVAATDPPGPPPNAEVLLEWDFEDGTQGWGHWSSVPMEQSSKRGEAASGRRALWGRIDEQGPLVHLIDGVRIPMTGTWLRFSYFVPGGSTFDHLDLNLRTHEHGPQSSPIFQTAIGLTKGAWTQVELPFTRFFGWSEREFGSFTIREFEVAAVGVGELLLDDVQILRDPDHAPPPAPRVLWLKDQDATQAPAGKSARFRGEFTVATAPRFAWVQAGGDEEGHVWINGVDLGVSSLGSPREHDLSGVVRRGRNIVAIEVRNHGNTPNPSGAIAVVGWGDESPTERIFCSDETWRATDAEVEVHWTAVGFDDSDWPQASVAAVVPQPPWGTIDIYPLRKPSEAPHPGADTALPEPCLQDRTTRHRLRGTGFFRTEEAGGRWWLVDPDGYPFWSTAVNAVFERPDWSMHYHRHVRETYASLDHWGEATCGRLSELGFNSSTSSGESYAKRDMPYFAGWNLTWAGPWLEQGDGQRVMFPDVFDPAWRKGAEERVKETAERYRDDPLLIGYFTDNEITMHAPFSTSQGIMGAFWSPGCRAELARWLGERYGGDIATLNRAWTSPHHEYTYASFEELPLDKPTIRADDDPVAQDLRDFVRHVIRTYAEVYVGLWKKHDPNHLVCSNRFAGAFDLELAELLQPYDIIACNSYPRSYWGQTGFDEGQLTWLRGMHEATGKPVLVTEWGVTAVDSGLPNHWGRLDTQHQRGQAYRNVLRQLWNEGYVVGSHWFCWADSTDAERKNWGIVNGHGEEYEPLTRAMVRAHHTLQKRVRNWTP